MEIALLLAQQIAQLFLILFCGYLIVRTGLLRAADSKVLSVILVYLVIPCVIIDAFQIQDSPQVRAGLLVSFGAAAAIHVVFLALTAVLRRPLGLDAVERATAIYSNAGALVIPLVQALLGQEYVIYSCAFIIVQLVLLWTHGSTVLRGAGSISLKSILTNVNLISILVGAVLYLGHIPLPSVLVGAMDSMGNLMGPLGMLLAGMAIAESDGASGDAAGRHGHRGISPEAAAVHPSLLPYSCSAAADLSPGRSGFVVGVWGCILSARRQGHPDDCLSGRHHSGLHHHHLHGPAVRPGCREVQLPLCPVHTALHRNHAGDAGAV